MARVYLETSFISACVSDRTDVASVYRRQTSLEWWQTQRPRHDVLVSAEVYTELRNPSFRRGEDAVAFIAGIPVLDIEERVGGLAEIFVRERVMPGPAAGDALHVAVACIHDVEYLLSWNVRHLANPNKLAHLRVICQRVGLIPPLIVTPDFLWEQNNEPA